jgi:predicted nucleic-acid-binding protein
LIAFDTNLVIRLLVADDAQQLAKVTRLVAEADDAAETILLSLVTLSETVWVLRTSYSVPKPKVHAALVSLVEEPRFEIENRALVVAALGRYLQGRADFSDYLVGEVARERGARTTLTFDRKLRRESGFTFLN